MNVLSWFKPKNKHNIVIPAVYDGKQLHGFELVKAFTTEVEPKIKDYPKSQYKVYWETQIESVPGGGYCALVRFYSFDSGKVVKEQTFVFPDIPQLKEVVDNFIRSTLADNKR